MVHGLVNIKTYSRNGTRLKKLEEHLKRMHNDYKNKNIDKSRTTDNVILIKSDDTYIRRVDKVIEENNLKLNKDTGVVLAAVIKLNATDSEDLKDFTKDDYINVFKNQREHFIRDYGITEDSILDSVIHFDESEPHLHLTFIPKTSVVDKEKSDKELESYLQKECSKKARQELKKEVDPKEFDKLPPTREFLKMYHKGDTSIFTEDNKDILILMGEKYREWREKAENKGWGKSPKRNAGKITISKSELGLGGQSDFKKLQDRAFEWTKDSLKKIDKGHIHIARKFYDNVKYEKDIEIFKDIQRVPLNPAGKDIENIKSISSIESSYEIKKNFTGGYNRESVDNAMQDMKSNIEWLKKTGIDAINDKINLESRLRHTYEEYRNLEKRLSEVESDNRNLTGRSERFKKIIDSNDNFFKSLEDNNKIRKEYEIKEYSLKKREEQVNLKESAVNEKYNLATAKEDKANELISKYNSKLKDFETEINSRVTEKYNSQFYRLERFLDNNNFIDALGTFDNNLVTSKIKEVNQSYLIKQDRLNSMDSEISEKSEKLAGINETIGKRLETLEKHNKAIDNNKNLVASQKKEYDENIIKINEQNRIINENRNQLERVKRLDLEIKEKEKILKELEMKSLENDRLQSKNDELKKSLSKLEGLKRLESYFYVRAEEDISKYLIDKKGYNEDKAKDVARNVIDADFGLDLVMAMEEYAYTGELDIKALKGFRNDVKEFDYMNKW